VGPLEVFYWDSCLFYEHLKGEQIRVDKKVAIEEMLHDNKNKRNRICTSVITHTEILPKKLGAESEAKYWSMFGSMYFYDIDISRQILLLAREIKDFYFEPKRVGAPNGKMMSTGDAIHLATAIAHDVTEFHTRDANRKGGNVALLGLADADGKLCGAYPLKIISPSTAQGQLDV
jgi:predicted nucleic acid-binding protein